MNKRSLLCTVILVLSLLLTNNYLVAEESAITLDASSNQGLINLLDGNDSIPVTTPNVPAVPENKVQPQPQAQSQTQAQTTGNETEKIKFKTADDKTEALVIKEHSDHETIEVNIDGQAFIMKARMNKPGVRKYKELIGTDEKSLIAEVKIKDDSFKLVDENDKLLWKVKFKGEKVKISDNEDNKNPFELKKSEDKVKVKDKNGKEIARVKYYSDNGKLKLKDMTGKELYISKSYTKLSGAIGVMAINEIPAKYRVVIAAELAKQGF